jgi:hypothetical protein
LVVVGVVVECVKFVVGLWFLVVGCGKALAVFSRKVGQETSAGGRKPNSR